jgi:prevent-host-death family protein
MASQIVSATEFKAKCLALLDEVSNKGGTITVTKRGKPVATVSPVKAKPFKSKGIWKGKIRITDEDIRAVREEMWNPERLKEKFGF